ncbi:MAG TPA: tyrosine-type recombinase/integrase [Opitutaceae bacterium]|nr:tyrosine-type recombinase/integrase [Opitutaceae bacterium]
MEALGLPVLSVRDALGRPLSDLFAVFLADLEARQKSQGTFRKYRSLLKGLQRACGWNVLRDVNASAFCDWRKVSGLSPKSLNDHLGVWSRLFRWMKRQRLVLENPFEFVDPVDTRASARQYRRALSNEDVVNLLATAPWPRVAVYRFILETGLRRLEMKRLRWGDIVLETSGARVRVPSSISKNRKTTVHPLGPQVVADLMRLRPDNAAPFTPVFEAIPRLGTLRRDLARVGIPFVDELGRRADLHALRMTAIDAVRRSGATPDVLMQFARHSDLRLTMKVYLDAAHLEEPLAQAVARLPWHLDSRAPASAAGQ